MRAVAREADEIGGGKGCAGGSPGGVPRDPHEYSKPWRNHMKRKAPGGEPPKDASKAAGGAPDPAEVSSWKGSSPTQGAVAHRDAADSGLPSRDTGPEKESAAEWMVRKEKERRAAAREEKLRELRLELEKKARLEKTLREAELRVRGALPGLSFLLGSLPSRWTAATFLVPFPFHSGARLPSSSQLCSPDAEEEVSKARRFWFR